MPSPGAAMSTSSAPKFEKDASLSFDVDAATARMWSSLNAAGYSGDLSMFSPLLPAATTSSAFFFFANLTASCSASDLPLVPKEQLMIFAPLLTAYSIPAIASDVVPRPRESRNLTGTTFPDQHTPATPVPLSPRPATMPATWVPCPSLSSPDPLPLIALKPWASSTYPFLSSSLPLPGLSLLSTVRLQVGMVEIDTGVEHRDLRAARARRPRVRRVDVVVVGAVPERVLGFVERIVGCLRGREVEVVALGVGDLRPARKAPPKDPQRRAGARADDRKPPVPDGAEPL